MIRVLVVDDQLLVRTGFRMILDAEPDLEVVGEAGDGAEALERYRETAPDVVLMDVRMPGMDGVEATRHLAGADLAERAQRAWPERPGRRPGADDMRAKVLVLTTFDLDEHVYDALRAGASGFLLKDTPPEELVAAVRVVARGEALLAPSVTRRLIADFARRPAAPSGHATTPALATLTEREREVLVLMAGGLSNAEIAGALHLGETTVKTHVGRVLMKLGLRDRVQAVVLAYETGLVHPGG